MKGGGRGEEAGAEVKGGGRGRAEERRRGQTRGGVAEAGGQGYTRKWDGTDFIAVSSTSSLAAPRGLKCPQPPSTMTWLLWPTMTWLLWPTMTWLLWPTMTRLLWP